MPTNLAQAIIEQAQRRPDLRIGTTDDQITLAAALGHAAARATDLAGEAGPLAMLAPTSTNYVITWLACILSGRPVALINPTYPDDLVAQLLRPLNPSRVLRAEDIATARAGRPESPAGRPGGSADPFAVVSYMHTSGTTGIPKLCAQSHDYFHRLAAAMAGALELTAADRVLAPLPLFHINPMGYGVITALLTGADALTVPRFSASGFWPTVVEERITVLILHAPPVEILKRATPADAADGHQVRTMFYADREFMQRFGIPAAVSGYGSTEAGGVCHLQRWRIDDAIPDNASRYGGSARADIDWRLDADGIIAVRERERAAMFDGYLTANGIDPARDGDGWFDTGDLGQADGDRLVFLERAAESIRVKGEFVPIPFVENHLADLGLADHALWKRPGELVDDDVVLYAVADPLPLEKLRTRIADLPPFMRPIAVARVADLPRDAAAGKVQRRRLAEHPVLEWVEL